MKSKLPPPPLSYRLSHKLLGPILNRFHLSCGHFSELSVQSMDRSLSAGERFRYRIHWIVCSLCRKFERQMRSLSSLVKASISEEEQTQPTPEFLEHVKREIEKTPRDHPESDP